MKLIYPAAVLAVAVAGIAHAQSTSSASKAAPTTAPGAKPAIAPPPRTDATCLLVSNVFAQQSTDATQKAHAGNVFLYYFGRLDGRYTEAQLKVMLKQAGAAQFTGDSAATLMNNCVQNMEERAKVLESVSQQLRQGK